MKKNSKYVFLVILFTLVVGNVAFVISGVKLSKEIHEFEVNTLKYKEENTRLETEVSMVSSLQFASSMSAVLSIDKRINPIYLNNAPFALNR